MNRIDYLMFDNYYYKCYMNKVCKCNLSKLWAAPNYPKSKLFKLFNQSLSDL